MRAEFSAFRARLEAHPILAGKIDTAIRITTTGEAVRENYVVAYPASPTRLDDDRYTAVPTAVSASDFDYDVRYVAVDADGVLILADATHKQLVGHRLTVAGRACSPLRLVPGVEEGRVEFDRASRLYYLDDTFRFTSRPA